MNFVHVPSLSIATVPLSTTTCKSPVVKVPTKTTSRADWLMLMKPPAPARRLPNLLTLRLPSASACAS